MGTYSFFISSRGNAELCKVDWESIDSDLLFNSSVLKRCYKEAVTLEDVANQFNESKLFGYLTDGFIYALYEFNFHLIPYGSNPILYFTCEEGDVAYALEFFPGTYKIHIHKLNYAHLLSSDWSWEEYNALKPTLPDRGGWVYSIL
jgi:hypothetical protein